MKPRFLIAATWQVAGRAAEQVSAHLRHPGAADGVLRLARARAEVCLLHAGWPNAQVRTGLERQWPRDPDQLMRRLPSGSGPGPLPSQWWEDVTAGHAPLAVPAVSGDPRTDDRALDDFITQESLRSFAAHVGRAVEGADPRHRGVLAAYAQELFRRTGVRAGLDAQPGPALQQVGSDLTRRAVSRVLLLVAWRYGAHLPPDQPDREFLHDLHREAESAAPGAPPAVYADSLAQCCESHQADCEEEWVILEGEVAGSDRELKVAGTALPGVHSALQTAARRIETSLNEAESISWAP